MILQLIIITWSNTKIGQEVLVERYYQIKSHKIVI